MCCDNSSYSFLAIRTCNLTPCVYNLLFVDFTYLYPLTIQTNNIFILSINQTNFVTKLWKSIVQIRKGHARAAAWPLFLLFIIHHDTFWQVWSLGLLLCSRACLALQLTRTLTRPWQAWLRADMKKRKTKSRCQPVWYYSQSHWQRVATSIIKNVTRLGVINWLSIKSHKTPMHVQSFTFSSRWRSNCDTNAHDGCIDCTLSNLFFLFLLTLLDGPVLFCYIDLKNAG